MPRYLVVAHQTADSPELAERVRALVRRNPAAEFVLLVPATSVSRRRAQEEQGARAVAQRSAEDARTRIEHVGGKVIRTCLGDASPLVAIAEELGKRAVRYDAIILCTFPRPASRWLHTDLPHQVEKRFRLPVMHVVAKPPPAGRAWFFRRRSDMIDLLRQVPLFSSLSQRHLSLLARHAVEMRYGAGEVLARQGQHGADFFVIGDGRARVERDGRRIAQLEAGDFFGEMSLIDGKPRSATVIAETPMVLLVIHRRSFSDLLAEAPGLSRTLLVTLSERLREADAALSRMN